MTTAENFAYTTNHAFYLLNRRYSTFLDYLALQVSAKTRRFLTSALYFDRRFNVCFRLALRFALCENKGDAECAKAAVEYRRDVKTYLVNLYGIDEDRVNRICSMIVRWANA